MKSLDEIKGFFDKWPFPKMEVGEIVHFDVEKVERRRIQTYVHSYGFKVGKAFKTKNESATGRLYVQRVK